MIGVRTKNKRQNEDREECVGVSTERDFQLGGAKAGGEVKSSEGLREECPSP